MAVANLDATALFHDLAYGADELSGLVALLAAVDALSQVTRRVVLYCTR